MDELAQIERTTCACELCRAPCRTMPGSLAPGDLEAMAAHCGVRGDDALPWFLEHFAASEGAMVMRQGKLFRIPTIVPQQDERGHCVFLRADGMCAVHPVSPFGCSRHDMHMDRQEGDRRSKALLAAALNDSRYRKHWLILNAAGKVPRGGTLTARREAMQRELDAVVATMQDQAEKERGK